MGSVIIRRSIVVRRIGEFLFLMGVLFIKVANVIYSALGTQALLESVVHYDQTNKDAEGGA